MIQADQARAVTAVKPNAHGLTNRTTARTDGMSSSPPACLIAAFTSPARPMSAPSTYREEVATACPVSPNPMGVRNSTTPKPTTTQSCQRLHAVMAATSWARPRTLRMRWARPPGARSPGFRAEPGSTEVDMWSLMSSTSCESRQQVLARATTYSRSAGSAAGHPLFERAGGDVVVDDAHRLE